MVAGGGREYRGSRRRSTRVVLEARAGDDACPVRLYDVSVAGCRIDCATFDFAPDDPISLRFAEAITVDGRIAWCSGGLAGVRFTNPLPEAIARHLRTEPEDALEARG